MFSLTDADQPYEIGLLRPGSSYHLLEDALPDWALFNASCDDGSLPENIDLSPGEIVTCTFINHLSETNPPTGNSLYLPLVRQ